MYKIIDISGKDHQSQIIAFLNLVAPEQTPFVTGVYFAHGENFVFGAFTDDGVLVAVIRYCKQKVGAEQGCEPVQLESLDLYEAKINAFAVHSNYRGQGHGTSLQLHVIEHARSQSCYQVASYSTYDKVENYAIKLKLGFCCQPEVQSDGTRGCYFLMRLK